MCLSIFGIAFFVQACVKVSIDVSGRCLLTMLAQGSRVAKAGGPMKARRMLGYHSKGTDKSTLVYSRDVMAWPLRHLGKTLRLVQKGMFDTDCTRSGYWTNQRDEMACDAFNLAHVALAEEVVSNDPSRKCSNPNPVEANQRARR